MGRADWASGRGQAAGRLQRGGYHGKSVQAGVHCHHHCSEPVPVFHLNIYILRNIHPGRGSCGKRETLVAPAVMLEPLSYSLGLMFGFKT